jgi:hypothetical protein
MNWIPEGRKIIYRARSRVVDAEAQLIHSYTPEQVAEADDAMAAALRFLARAERAQRDWDAVQHDDYEAYPEVAETDDFAPLI